MHKGSINKQRERFSVVFYLYDFENWGFSKASIISKNARYKMSFYNCTTYCANRIVTKVRTYFEFPI